jgi:hypothetical protein
MEPERCHRCGHEGTVDMIVPHASCSLKSGKSPGIWGRAPILIKDRFLAVVPDRKRKSGLSTQHQLPRDCGPPLPYPPL